MSISESELVRNIFFACSTPFPTKRLMRSPATAGQVISGNCRTLLEQAALLSTGLSLRVPLAEILNDSVFSASSGGSVLEQAEREQILRALRESNWVVGGARGAAARLGLKRTSLAYKMQKLGISRPPQ